ncbi:molybdenum cofactor guanylyltransferase MobA [Solimonas marina]|uniref:Molybdenum cofactor guanylyltransferase n=1 Tax=Solimonas marina TaxID=2714601 RepID=A0A969WC32_9GAMM|nr:molybdenum cofactor guanylyltransferase [Solimonas marina]
MDAVVLAGGRATRMGGADKGLLPLRGRPLVQHVLDALRPQVAQCWISANRHLDRYAAFAETVADSWPDYRGPLAGIAAAADRCRQDWLLAAPCDTPGLPADVVAQLQFALRDGATTAAYAVIDDNPLYPFCLLHRSRFADLRLALERGQYAVGRWLAAADARAVAISGWHGPLLNLNTPALLADAQNPECWNPHPPS